MVIIYDLCSLKTLTIKIIHITPAIMPINPATANSAAILLTMIWKLNTFSLMISMTVSAHTMHNTSVTADSMVSIEYVSPLICSCLIKGITNADEMPPRIEPVSNEVSRSNPNAYIIPETTIAEMIKLKNVMPKLFVTPRTKDARSMVNAPSYSKNNNANVVNTGANPATLSGWI